jgi:hypothetical protein
VTLVRVGPVHFQSLERELEPVAKYLTGRFLNAGAGTRDITAFLRSHGVTEITKYDIASSDPDVITGALESMPFDDASFDSVLCNAVLEHVEDAESAMREIARVVKRGGHVVAAVPFLQPYHPCPGDFRRYTADGLKQLGEAAGLELIEMLPVHSFAQTIGWLLVAYAEEKGGWLRRRVMGLIAYVITLFWNRTDAQLKRNANTYQAVFRRSESESVIGTTWRRTAVPVEIANVTTMLIPDELRLLHHLGRNYASGAGAIVDAGCFFGGSTVALASGLRRNPVRGLRIDSYDRFEVEEWTRGIYFPESTPAGTSFRDQFDRNVAPYADLINVHAGDITSQPWTGGPIEILFIDVAKNVEVCDWVTWQFFPHLIPGRSLVIQQDYLYHHWVAWLHVTMEYYADYFEYVCDTGINSVVFLNTKKIPEDVLRRDTVASLSIDEKRALMDRAASRFEGPKRELMLSAKAHFLEQLAS